jgi:hypothetical protein
VVFCSLNFDVCIHHGRFIFAAVYLPNNTLPELKPDTESQIPFVKNIVLVLALSNYCNNLNMILQACLKVPGMKKISLCITWSDNIQDLPHVIEDTHSPGCIIINLMVTDPVLYLRKCFLYGIEVGGIRGKVLNPYICQFSINLMPK